MGITSLPIELIENILSCEDLSISDVVSFLLTNQYYYSAIRNLNAMWKEKYLQTWPGFSKLFEEKNCKICWYDEIRYVYDLKRRTREMLTDMHGRLYKRCHLLGSDFKQWIDIYDESPRTYDYLARNLTNILHTRTAINTKQVVPITTPGNLTLQYYAYKVWQFVKHLHVTKEWLAYAALPPKQRTMEKGAVLVIQWCRPETRVSWRDILPKHLDELAKKVKKHLKVIDPNHPLFSVPEEDLERWRNENIEGNKYGIMHYKKVVKALESVFGFNHEYINSDESNGDILKNNVLFQKILDGSMMEVCGVPKSLVLLYESVARRLGLKYELTHESGKATPFKLRLSEFFYNSEEEMTQSRLQIFVAATDKFVNCLVNDPVEPCSNTYHDECVRCEKLYPYLQRLRFLQIFTPVVKSPQMFMMKCYLDSSEYSIHILNYVMEQRICELNLVRRAIKLQLKDYALKNHHDIFRTKPEVRPSNLKYAVGMLVNNQRGHTGVVCDWKMTSTISGEAPLYKVLFRGGVYVTLAQDELKLYSGRNLEFSVHIGKNFSHAYKTHFVPNAEKEKEYPADAAIRWKFHKNVMMARNK